ncbi:MAG: DUF721 domain-containing protein [Bauldia sp.]|nr:DUF721 domain-containing protein [Bauldia sp.]
MSSGRSSRPAQPIARLAGAVLDPLVARRGFASASLLSAWEEVVGPRYAAVSQPEKITWPRGRDGAGVLTVRVEGPGAVYLQHDSGPFIERINRYLGFTAVADIRIVQKPLERPRKRGPRELRPLSPAEQSRVAATVAGTDDPDLARALTELGERVIADRLPRP